mgnify:FL=1
MDAHGVCLISDLNTNDYRLHLNMEAGPGKQYFQISINFEHFPSLMMRYTF